MRASCNVQLLKVSCSCDRHEMVGSLRRSEDWFDVEGARRGERVSKAVVVWAGCLAVLRARRLRREAGGGSVSVNR